MVNNFVDRIQKVIVLRRPADILGRAGAIFREQHRVAVRFAGVNDPIESDDVPPPVTEVVVVNEKSGWRAEDVPRCTRCSPLRGTGSSGFAAS